MLRLKTICVSLALLSLAGTATANSSAKLDNLEKQRDRLNAYHAQSCTGPVVAQDCARVSAGINKLSVLIERLTSSMQKDIAGAAFERTIKPSGDSRLQQQYNQYVAKLQKVNQKIELMLHANVPSTDARLQGLQNEGSVLHMRLLRLQSRLKGTS